MFCEAFEKIRAKSCHCYLKVSEELKPLNKLEVTEIKKGQSDVLTQYLKKQ